MVKKIAGEKDDDELSQQAPEVFSDDLVSVDLDIQDQEKANK